VRLTARTYAAFALTGALDTGRYDDLSVDEIRPAIDDGSVFAFLERRLGSDYRLGRLSDGERAELADEWMHCSNAIDARRTSLVERNGLCLLIAYVVNGIQKARPSTPRSRTSPGIGGTDPYNPTDAAAFPLNSEPSRM
jgi:hypothetical protein